MTLEFVTRNWSLVAASVLITAIAMFVLFRVYTDSARGQLRARLRALKARYQAVDKADAAVLRCERKLARLGERVASVKPRHVEEAREALEDARALLKIATDQVLIAENHVRTIIVEEFPPNRQDALRHKYLRNGEGQGKPFTFGE